MRSRSYTGFSLALGLAIATVSVPGEAKVARTTLGQLIMGSEAIMIAHVEGLLSFDGLTVARAVPARVLKGRERGTPIYFVAGPTWACDTSTAVRGETVLLFLLHAKSARVERRHIHRPTARVAVQPLYFLDAAGRGRLPIREVNGQPTVLIRNREIEVSAGLRPVSTTDHPWAGPVGHFRLADVEKTIRNRLSAVEPDP
jgi:hypothetical protein